MKKTIIALVVLLAAALLFTGCPKEPEVPESLDGTWYGWIESSVHPQLAGYVSAPMAAERLEISGNSAKLNMASDEYALAFTEWVAGNKTGPEPVPSWDEEHTGTGTITENNGTITLIKEGTTFTGTLSSDRKSFSTEFNGMTAIFKKQ